MNYFISLVVFLLSLSSFAAPGVAEIGTAIEFSIESRAATHIELYLYQKAQNQDEIFKIALSKNKNNHQTWSVRIQQKQLAKLGLKAPFYYGYRIWGPNWVFDPAWVKGSMAGFISDVDHKGNRFNPNKLLIDPYAKELSHDPVNASNLTTYPYATGEYRHLDSGKMATKSIYFKTEINNKTSHIRRSLKDDIIYEAHIRGLTYNHPTVPSAYRGTYKGATYLISYFKKLGVTAIELLPVQETQNDQNDLVQGTQGDNYWGYMTLNYFSPDRRYSFDKSAGGPSREFRAMTDAFHQAGIKIFIDVVYNHTAEGGLWQNPDTAELYSFRGIDNAMYYTLAQDPKYYWDNTGIGNNFNLAEKTVTDLTIDSLKHWHQNLGVDGFRFDLAAVLGNRCTAACFEFDKMNSANILNRIVNELPSRNLSTQGADLIAEPWGIGTFEQGQFPTGWAEWNGSFRDTLRKQMNKLGYEKQTPAGLATRIAGSADLFQDDGRKPFQSINFIVAHDGFTLRDLFSYNEKNNLIPWPYGPSDGGEDHNISWDQNQNKSEQLKATKNALALLMLSAGTPMITAGDEFYRTQYGNNNAYNLDSEKNWLDWNQFYNNNQEATEINTFTKQLMQFRQNNSALRRAEYYDGTDHNQNGLKDITWLTTEDEADTNYLLNADHQFLGFRIDASEDNNQSSEVRSILVYYNSSSDFKVVKLPKLNQSLWQVELQTGSATAIFNNEYKMQPRSLVLFVEK